eukprot:m.39158 g.39158  ORF g.39158 m.39158 type:complete len:87 (-) comp12642_c0_seq2:3-263(-)
MVCTQCHTPLYLLETWLATGSTWSCKRILTTSKGLTMARAQNPAVPPATDETHAGCRSVSFLSVDIIPSSFYVNATPYPCCHLGAD